MLNTGSNIIPIMSNDVNQIQGSLNSLTIDVSTLTYNTSDPTYGWKNWKDNYYYSSSLVLVCKYYLTKIIINDQIKI